MNPQMSSVPVIQQKCAACAQKERIQMKSPASVELDHLNDDFIHQLNARKGMGNPLPEGVKAEMEAAFGTDFQSVRIHTDEPAIQLNRQLVSLAFTHGQDIFFNEGEYNPSSTEGQKLLAHELTHVVQQASRVSGKGGSYDDLIQRQIDPQSGDTPVLISSTDPFELFYTGRRFVRDINHEEVEHAWIGVDANPTLRPYNWVRSGQSSISRAEPVFIPGDISSPVSEMSSVEPGIYFRTAGSGVVERLYRDARGGLVWRRVFFSASPSVYAYEYAFIGNLIEREEASEEAPIPARSRVPGWAWRQWQEAVVELERRRRQEAENADALSQLPERLVIIPGPGIRVFHNYIGLRPPLRQRRSDSGEDLLLRAINQIATMRTHVSGPSSTTEGDQTPDWVRAAFDWVDHKIEEDRERYRRLAIADSRNADVSESNSEDEQEPSLLAQVMERQNLLEMAVGLPSRIELRIRNGRYGVRITLGNRSRLISMEEEQSPIQLYTRILAVGQRLADLEPEREEQDPSNLVRGSANPWPVFVENIGSEIAVAGHAHWFTVHVSFPQNVRLIPTLGAYWSVIPIQEGDTEDQLGEAREAESGEVAELELAQRSTDRVQGVINDLPLTALGGFGVLATGELLGVMGDRINYGLDLLSELGSGDRGIVFPRPGRYVVRVRVFPHLSREDAQRFNISEENVPAPASVALVVRVESAAERAVQLANDGESLEVEGRIPDLLSERDRLRTRIQETEQEGEPTEELEAELAVIERRLRSLRFQTNIFGYLARLEREANEQAHQLRRILAYWQAPDDFASQVREQMLESGSQEPQELVDLFDSLQAQWQEQELRGHRPPDFQTWLQVQLHQLEASRDVRNRQRQSLFVSGRDRGSSHRLPAAFVAYDGRQLPLMLSVTESVDSENNRTTVTLLDLSEVGAPNSQEDAREFRGTTNGTSYEARKTAFEQMLREYKENCGYGRGLLVFNRPVFWDPEVGLPNQWVFSRRPGRSERWQERLENIATAAALVGLVLSGPLAAVIGAVGAISGAGAAAIRLQRRSSQGILRANEETFTDLVDIFTAPLATASAASSVLDGFARLGFVVSDSPSTIRRVIQAGSNADDFIGMVQMGGQALLIPSRLLHDIESLEGLEEHERRRHMLDMLLGYTRQFGEIIVSIHGLTQREYPNRVRETDPSSPGGRRSRELREGGTEEPLEGSNGTRESEGGLEPGGRPSHSQIRETDAQPVSAERFVELVSALPPGMRDVTILESGDHRSTRVVPEYGAFGIRGIIILIGGEGVHAGDIANHLPAISLYHQYKGLSGAIRSAFEYATGIMRGLPPTAIRRARELRGEIGKLPLVIRQWSAELEEGRERMNPEEQLRRELQIQALEVQLAWYRNELENLNSRSREHGQIAALDIFEVIESIEGALARRREIQEQLREAEDRRDHALESGTTEELEAALETLRELRPTRREGEILGRRLGSLREEAIQSLGIDPATHVQDINLELILSLREREQIELEGQRRLLSDNNVAPFGDQERMRGWESLSRRIEALRVEIQGLRRIQRGEQIPWRDWEDRVDSRLRRQFSRVGRQIWIQVILQSGRAVRIRVDNLIMVGPGVFRIVDAKRKDTADLTGDNYTGSLTENEGLAYPEIAQGTAQSITIDDFDHARQFGLTTDEELTIDFVELHTNTSRGGVRTIRLPGNN